MFRYLCLAAVALHAAPANPVAVRGAANRSIALLQKVGSNWRMGCFSCHTQALPALALQEARAHGLSVDEKSAQSTANRAFAMFSSLDDAVQDPFVIDIAVSEGYSVIAADAAGIAPNAVLGTYARRIANHQQEDGGWPLLDGRPPHSGSLFAATAIAARAVALYLPNRPGDQKAQVLSKTRAWMLAHRPASSEDITFQLLGLKWTDPAATVPAELIQAAFTLQRDDGGWAQVPERPSDAYATGQVLYALASAGVTADNAPWQRGIDYLLKTQAADGSWHVTTRLHSPAPISPPYFESGFPYKHDQYLSTAATSWSVMALASALPMAAKPARPLKLPAAQPQGLQPWMETALFGTAEELDKALKSGLAPEAATPGGTTVMMMAANDTEKIRLLLARGAKATTRAKSGYDALMCAALVRHNTAVVSLLLENGAQASPKGEIRFDASPLVIAAFPGDAETLELLLDHGADPLHRMTVIGMIPALALDVASYLEHTGAMRTLVRHGTPVDSPDKDGLTNLSFVSIYHKNKALKTMLELGADPAHKDNFGYTPLKHAASIDHMSPETGSLLTSALERHASGQ